MRNNKEMVTELRIMLLRLQASRTLVLAYDVCWSTGVSGAT